ncbi:MAG: nuclear transport factor 2 family protein [Burkholderiaceae bacterium]
MSQEIIKEIEALDERRAQATIAKDAATLGELLGDDLVYVHSSATTESKSQFIERATTGFYDYRGLTNLARTFRVLGDVALVNGDVRIEVVVKGSTKNFVSRYLQVWARRGDRWQMVSWQSTPVPSA